MGAGCACERDPANVSDPINNLIVNRMEEQLAEFLLLDHPLNVNKKYAMFFEVNGKSLLWTNPSNLLADKFTGQGI